MTNYQRQKQLKNRRLTFVISSFPISLPLSRYHKQFSGNILSLEQVITLHRLLKKKCQVLNSTFEDNLCLSSLATVFPCCSASTCMLHFFVTNYLLADDTSCLCKFSNNFDPKATLEPSWLFLYLNFRKPNS